MNKKVHRNVLDLARHTSVGSELPKQLEQRIQGRRLVKKLMAIRAVKGLSQQDIAESIGCSQSRISKFEMSNDNDLRLGDLKEYLRSADLDLRLIICPKDWPASEQIKFHAFFIRDCLSQLVESARTGDSVLKAQDFHIDVLCNLLKLIAESAQKLPDVSVETPDVFEAEEAEQEIAGPCPPERNAHECARLG